MIKKNILINFAQFLIFYLQNNKPMFKRFSYFAICSLMAMAAFSCKDTPETTPDPLPDPGKEEMEELTPAQSKKFLDDAALDFLNKFQASDQRDIIELASWASYAYEDLEAPEEFEIEGERVNPAKFIRELSRALKAADGSRAGSATVKYVYNIYFDRFTGIYEPGDRRWIKRGTSNDVIFRFKDKYGRECELKASAAKGTSDISAEVDDYDCDDNRTTDTYNVKIPKEVHVVLIASGKTLADIILESDIDIDGHKFKVATQITAANINAVVTAEGNDTKISQASSFAVDGETLVVSNATINGSRMCDRAYYENVFDKGDFTKDDFLTIVKNGTAVASVLNRVRVDGEVEFNRDVLNGIDAYWDSYDYTKSQAEAAVKRSVDALNKNVVAIVRYNNTVTEQARLYWQSAYESWGSDYWEYWVEPVLMFKKDGTTYAFEEYFENGFGNIESLWNDLLDSYDKVWSSARR